MMSQQPSAACQSRIVSIIKFLDFVLEAGFPLAIVFLAWKVLSSIPTPPPGF